MKKFDRREFLCVAAAATVSTVLGGTDEQKVTPPKETPNQGVTDKQADKIYRENIVIDCLATPVTFNVPCCPPPDQFTEEQLNNVRRSGITAVNLGLCCPSDIKEAYREIAFWHGEINKHSSDLLLVRKIEDIVHAKQVNKLGIIIGFQTAEMFGEELEIIQDFYNLGMRIQQLTYNKRNLIGNGCLEPGDGGLSRFGRKFVARLNELGVAIDFSHCGTKTTADAIEYSKKPVLITHSGCREVYQHPRNKEDSELRAMADRGGVIGIYLMSFVGNDGTLYANKEMVLNLYVFKPK